MTAVALAPRARSLSANRLGIAALLVLAFAIVPFTGSEYLFEAILTPFLALALAAVGLNLLTGYAGQISLGSAAFMAVGALSPHHFHLPPPRPPLIPRPGLSRLPA